MKKWALMAAAVAAISILVGCSSGPKTVEIQIQHMAFSTKEIILKQGVPVKLVLVNKDTVVHDLSVDTIPITAGTEAEAEAAHDHGGHQPDLHVSAKPGEQGTVLFTPIAAGTYTFYCTVPGHKDHGMQGNLVVTAAGA